IHPASGESQLDRPRGAVPGRGGDQVLLQPGGLRKYVVGLAVDRRNRVAPSNAAGACVPRGVRRFRSRPELGRGAAGSARRPAQPSKPVIAIAAATIPITGNIFLREMKYSELKTSAISSRPSPIS